MVPRRRYGGIPSARCYSGRLRFRTTLIAFLRARDIAPQRASFAFDFVEPYRDHIADRDEPGEFTVLDDRQLTDTAFGHGCHDVGNQIPRPAGHDMTAHQQGNRRRG